MIFRFIEDHIHKNGGIGSSKPDKINRYIFSGGVDCPKDSSLKISGPWVGASMFPSPMTFRFIEDHIHENWGTGSSKLDKITSIYFYRGRRLSP